MMNRSTSSATLLLLLALCSFLILSQVCGNGDEDNSFGFAVCSQLTDNPLQYNIISINEPMGRPTTLVAVEGHSAIDPVVTPDGRTLVFSANFEKPVPSGNDPPGGSLYKMDIADGDYTRVTDDD